MSERESGVDLVLEKRRRPTAADVARAAGVSAATVSYVLNNVAGQKISESTQSAVWAAAEQLGYRPNLAARNLRVGGSGVILFVIPPMGLSELTMQIGARLTAELAKNGIMLSLQFETADGKGVVEAIEDLHPVAVASTLPLTGAALEAVNRAGIPQYHLGSSRSPVLASLDQVVGEVQVGHLVARGHRRLAFVYCDDDNQRTLGDHWLAGIRDAAEKRQLPDIAVATVSTDGTDAAEVVRRLVADGVTAVCAHSDPTAFVLLHGIRQTGLRCPQDLAVIGIDASPTGYVSDPPLSSVEFNAETLLDIALERYMGDLGGPVPQAATRQPVARLVQRDST